jgi:hypothetical protein
LGLLETWDIEPFRGFEDESVFVGFFFCDCGEFMDRGDKVKIYDI